MSRCFLRLLVLVSLTLFTQNAAWGQSTSREDLAERRARIERMSPEERAQILERFEKLRQLPTERREKLFKRCETLKKRDRRLEQNPGFEQFRQRRESGNRRFGKNAFEYRRKLAARVEKLLPETVRSALAQATDDRARRMILKPHRRRMHDAHFLVEASDLLRFDRERARLILGLPDDQRGLKLREVHRELVEWGVKEHGLGKVSEPVWNKLREEPDAGVFLEGVRGLDLPLRKFRIPRPRGSEGDRGPGRRGPGRRGPGGPEGKRAKDGPGGPGGPDTPRGRRGPDERPPPGDRPERRPDRRSEGKVRERGTGAPNS